MNHRREPGIYDDFERIMEQHDKTIVDEFDYKKGTQCYKLVQIYDRKMFSFAFNPRKPNSYLIEYKFDSMICPNHNWTNGIYTFDSLRSCCDYINTVIHPKHCISINSKTFKNKITSNIFAAMQVYGFSERSNANPLSFFHDDAELSKYYIKKDGTIQPSEFDVLYDSIYIPTQENKLVFDFINNTSERNIVTAREERLLDIQKARAKFEVENSTF